MSKYSKDPRETRAKYQGTCANCGKEIKPGDLIYYYPAMPKGKRVYCLCSEEAYRRDKAQNQDEDQA